MADRIFKNSHGDLVVDMPEYPILVYANKEVKLINKKFSCKGDSQKSYLYEGASLTCSDSDISLASPDGSFSYSFEDGSAELALQNGSMEQKRIYLTHSQAKLDHGTSLDFDSNNESDTDQIKILSQSLGKVKVQSNDNKRRIVIDSGDGDSITIDGSGIKAKSDTDSWRITNEHANYDSQKIMKELKVSQTGSELKIDLPDSILFDFNSYELKEEASVALQKVSFLIKQKSSGKIVLEGHTDSVGSEESNLKLSKQRVQSVANWLTQQEGIPAAILEGKGYGESKPIAHNSLPNGSDDPEGRQKNRRVSFRFSAS